MTWGTTFIFCDVKNPIDIEWRVKNMAKRGRKPKNRVSVQVVYGDGDVHIYEDKATSAENLADSLTHIAALIHAYGHRSEPRSEGADEHAG